MQLSSISMAPLKENSKRHLIAVAYNSETPLHFFERFQTNETKARPKKDDLASAFQNTFKKEYRDIQPNYKTKMKFCYNVLEKIYFFDGVGDF